MYRTNHPEPAAHGPSPDGLTSGPTNHQEAQKMYRTNDPEPAAHGPSPDGPASGPAHHHDNRARLGLRRRRLAAGAVA